MNSEDSGEDLMENMNEDYRVIEGLDNYEALGIDDEEYSDIDEE